MNQKEFLEEFEEMLQCEETITKDTILDTLAEWDSLSLIGTVSMIAKLLDVRISINDVIACQSVTDIMNLTENKLSD